MGLFSSNPKNRRRRKRSSQRKESSDLLSPATTGNPKARSRKGKSQDELGEQVFRLNAQIGALESFLAKKTAAEVRQIQMKRENILPPPDKASKSTDKRKKALSHAERRRYHAERSRNGIHFLFLFCLACAIGWWLIFSGV